MFCFGCHQNTAQFKNETNALSFCNDACQQAFYINGQFEMLLNRSDFDKNVFVEMLNQYRIGISHLKFINALIADATETQRNLLFSWILKDETIRGTVYHALASEKETVKYLIQRAIEANLKSLLYYVPIDTLTGRKFAVVSLDRTNDIELIRILHLKFNYTVNEFIGNVISRMYYMHGLNPEWAISVLKLFGTLLNDVGKEITNHFIKSFKIIMEYAEQRPHSAAQSLARAYHDLIWATTVPIEPEGNVKKLKKK